MLEPSSPKWCFKAATVEEALLLGDPCGFVELTRMMMCGWFCRAAAVCAWWMLLPCDCIGCE